MIIEWDGAKTTDVERERLRAKQRETGVIYALWLRHKNKCRPLGEESTGHKTKYTLRHFLSLNLKWLQSLSMMSKSIILAFVTRVFMIAKRALFCLLLEYGTGWVITDLPSSAELYQNYNKSKRKAHWSCAYLPSFFIKGSGCFSFLTVRLCSSRIVYQNDAELLEYYCCIWTTRSFQL